MAKKTVFKAMDDDTFEDVVAALISDAVTYVETDLAPERVASQKLFDAEHYGTEVAGRSQVHSSDVKDAILAKLPSFLRVFAGANNICEVVARDETEVNTCADMSATLDWMFMQKNDGYAILHSAIHDGELKKVGVITWWCDDETKVEPATYTGFTQAMIDIFKQAPGVEIVSQEPEDGDDADDDYATSEAANPQHKSVADSGMYTAAVKALQAAHTAQMGGAAPDDDDAAEPDLDTLPGNPSQTFTLKILRTVKNKKIRVCAVPPEELIISRDAVNEHQGSLIGRRREMTVGELVGLGYDEDDLLDYAESTDHAFGTTFDLERQARVPALQNDTAHYMADPSLRKLMFYEVYHRVDKDGYGYAPLRRTCLVGSRHHVVYDEVFEEDCPPFALLCGTPIPHAAIGLSTVDQVGEIQIQKTAIMRNMMDSLANSVWPKTAFDSTRVNVDDLLNSEPGALVRVQGQPSASITEFASSFIGAPALNTLAYIDDVKQKRIGVGDGSHLDGSELQSTTAVAAAAIVNQGQDRLELEARNYAEGIKKVFRGLLRCIIRHMPGPLPIRKRDGSFAQVTPGDWNPDADIKVVCALGRNSEQQRIALLQQILSVQSQLFQGAGLNQPLVGPQELRNTLEDLCTAMGNPAVSRYFKRIAPNWQPPPQKPQMDPLTLQAQAATLQAQVAQQKAQGEHLIALEKTRNDATQAAAKLAQDRYLAELEIQAKYGAQINQGAVDAAIERERLQRDSEVASALGMAELQHKSDQAALDRNQQMMATALTASQTPADPSPAPLGHPPTPPAPMPPQASPPMPPAPGS